MMWLIFRMPLRAAMPVSVMKPIMLATDSGWPTSHSAATEPISASGTLPMMISDSIRRAIAAVENRKDQEQRHHRQQADGARRLFLRLERAFETDEIAFRHLRLGHHAANLLDQLRHVGLAVAVGEHHEAAASVLAQDLVRARSFP